MKLTEELAKSILKDLVLGSNLGLRMLEGNLPFEQEVNEYLVSLMEESPPGGFSDPDSRLKEAMRDLSDYMG